jgi:urea transport system ATP-binding protein
VALLEIDHVFVYHKDALILNDVSLTVNRGEVVCVLGRNGVGKSTLLRSIVGLTPPRKGSVRFNGQVVSGRFPYEIVRMGIAYVPQGRDIFPDLSVEENLKVGAFINPQTRQKIKSDVFKYFPFLKDRLKQKGGKLSGGEQQMLAIARALAGDPEMMILDEPTEGIQPSIIKGILELIRQLNKDRGLTILLVEQNIDFAFDLASRGYILEKGQVVTEGGVAVLKEDHTVKTYLMI